jgi:hypothetical protein
MLAVLLLYNAEQCRSKQRREQLRDGKDSGPDKR